MNKVSDWR